jgi:ketol-acid reductoisomerase
MQAGFETLVEAGYAPEFLAMRKEHAEHQMEQVGDKLRSMMPWIAKNRLVDKGKD